MNRTQLNLWLDITLFVAMLGLAVTGGILHFVLPPGSGHFRSLFGLTRHDIGDIHSILALASIFLVATHVVLHWSWVCCALAKAMRRPAPSRRTRTIAGVVVLIATMLMMGVFWLAAPNYEAGSGPTPRRHLGLEHE